MPLTIYKSSAGSGKTFTLVKEYLKLILRRPKDFQHILAITFTNKATEEMKRRVLENLQQIAKGERGDMFEVLILEFEGELTEDLLKYRANEAYELIIHNYSRFEISTIDSFFSRVVRSFARELDLPMSYELEMNTAIALDEAVAQLFRSLSENKELRIWLEQYTFDQIENDKSWNVEGNILDLGRNLFKEQFQEGFSKVDISLDRLKELVTELKQVIKLYRQGMEALANDAIGLIEDSGLTVNDFSYGASGAANTFYKITKGNYDLGSRFIKTASGEQGWAKKKADNEALVDQLAGGRLGDLAMEILDYVDKHERSYRTAQALFRNIYAFGLLEALNANLKDYRDEQNIMLISDNNALIREIVRQDDAPFLFEKIGSFFKHILIDEFQDTSNFQWNNLLPLILNSLASGNQVLIVGDVKQSIYRFRGGNMRLLLEQIGQDLHTFREVITYKNLEENYRSLQGIVAFNNAFFELLPESLEKIQHVDDTAFIKSAYEGHKQVAKRGEGGHVEVALFKPDEESQKGWRERALDLLVENIHHDIKEGYGPSDFLVLVNKNSDMPEIAACLLKAGIPFVSERSLMLGSNDLIRFMIEALRFLQSEEDAIGLVNLSHLHAKLTSNENAHHFMRRAVNVDDLTQFGLPKAFLDQRRTLAQLPLFDLIEQLLLLFNFKDQGDVFIQKFQDLVLEQTQRGIHSIHGFLEWWEEQGQESTISINENTDAVRIMSVHKAKGLEAPIVHIPFADYSFLPNASMHSFWTSEVPEYLSDLSFVPLNYSKSGLVNTDFEGAFLEETLESVLDALNKTYVAFTRAKERLYISAPHKVLKPGGSFHQINHFLEAIMGEESLGMNLNENNNILKYVNKSIYNKPSKKEALGEMASISTYPNSSYINHLSIRPDSERFFMLQGTEDARNISLGNQVHEVLSLMTNAYEMDAVVNQLLLEGSVLDSDLPHIKERVSNLMNNAQIKSWFESDYQVFAERELQFDGRMLKPDRVMVKGDKAIIVDYKKEKPSDSHHAQVRHYMEALRALGYPETMGYLVYVDSVEIEEVVL